MIARVVLQLVAACAVLLALGISAAGRDFQKDLEARVEQLVKKNGEGTDQGLKLRLISMAKRDQEVRQPEYVSENAAGKLVREMERVDAELTAELKQIVAEKGWPTIALVGLQAADDATLIVIHSRDHDFQKRLVPELQRLAEEGRILGSGIALIVDKILVSEGRPQRFGTQFKFSDGRGEMLPVDDPAHLDERRAQYLLPPMSEYKKMLAELYHLKVQ